MVKNALTYIIVAGARPNFMKVAPLVRELKKQKNIRTILVHTGQHYDPNLSDVFFKELDIPTPDENLEVGSGSHATQTGAIMIKFQDVIERYHPNLVIVAGDVNSTIACALTAAKLGVKVAHVEAGLRSGDWSMPEEINRVLTDRLSDYLFCTEESAMKNLRAEGIDAKKIFFVGNVMIDTLLRERANAEHSAILKTLGLQQGGYSVLTLHRASNVDQPDALKKLMETLDGAARTLPMIFPVHPRTRAALASAGIVLRHIQIVDPLGYRDFMKLISNARCVITDSGGIQEETTILGVPCLTLRNNTERPVTITHGTNRLVGTQLSAIKKALGEFTYTAGKEQHGKNKKWGKGSKKTHPRLWDGKASERIVRILGSRLG